MLDEIELDHETPCIRFEHNEVRGLKNDESKRLVPIHPEILRLGFAGYVEALRGLGHTLLFPELKAASALTPMGDVFDDAWQEITAAALPDAQEQGKVLHSMRHWCNNEMKQLSVSSEIRRDILGHANGDVNEGRYTDPARLRLMASALFVLPQPTAHLSNHPILLLENVTGHGANRYFCAPSPRQSEGRSGDSATRLAARTFHTSGLGFRAKHF